MIDNDFKDKESEFDDGFGEGNSVGNSSGEHEQSKSDYACWVLASPTRVCLLVKHAVLVHQERLRWVRAREQQDNRNDRRS